MKLHNILLTFWNRVESRCYDVLHEAETNYGLSQNITGYRYTLYAIIISLAFLHDFTRVYHVRGRHAFFRYKEINKKSTFLILIFSYSAYQLIICILYSIKLLCGFSKYLICFWKLSSDSIVSCLLIRVLKTKRGVLRIAFRFKIFCWRIHHNHHKLDTIRFWTGLPSFHINVFDDIKCFQRAHLAAVAWRHFFWHHIHRNLSPKYP